MQSGMQSITDKKMVGQTTNKTIARNSIMLYMRMFLTMFVGLYTSRVVLATLGVEDYGIYGVVGGVVSMLGFLNASMSGATSRFLSYELGRGAIERLKKTFYSALILHVIIALIVLLLAETVGLWFLCNKLVIPENRMCAAHIVYQLSIISAMLSITQVPYNSCIIAHEKMDVYAYVEILNVILKLLIVFLLTIGDFDKLILYAILTLLVSIIIMMVYRLYCVRNFEESKFIFYWDKAYIMPLLSFSGWNVYSSVCFTSRQQGTNFILNFFGGAVLNAAASLAATVDGIITGFAYNVVMAFRPPLIKLYVANDLRRMERLLDFAITISVFLFAIVAVPLAVCAKLVLILWLGTVPDHTIQFLRIIFFSSAFQIVNSVLLIVVHATGNVKMNSIITGTLSVLNLVPLYFLLKIGFDVDIAYVVIILPNILISITHVCSIKKMIADIRLLKVYIRAISFIVMEYVFFYFFNNNDLASFDFGYLAFVFIANFLFSVVFIIAFMDKSQKQMIGHFLYTKCKSQFK